MALQWELSDLYDKPNLVRSHRVLNSLNPLNDSEAARGAVLEDLANVSLLWDRLGATVNEGGGNVGFRHRMFRVIQVSP